MMLYADSSFLLSLYLTGPKTAQATAILRQSSAPLAFTSFNRLELRNVLRSNVARRAATSAEVARTFVLIEGDLNRRLLTEKSLDLSKLFQMAEQLSSRHAEKSTIRCVDLLHVASAHVLGLKVFLTFDRQQGEFARQTGLTVKL